MSAIDDQLSKASLIMMNVKKRKRVVEGLESDTCTQDDEREHRTEDSIEERHRAFNYMTRPLFYE